ncbi:hypothetical protein FTX61_10520 [Nitriliruptoraceae bacterium ZYF776]|nr:hypothetical protein [Profundirhabdus halotolerans]
MPSTTLERAGVTRGRRRAPVPGRKHLAIATALVAVGSMLPWVQTAVGVTLWGFQGGGTLLVYAASLGLAGTLHRRARWMAVHAAVLAVATVTVTAWQLARLFEVCPAGACMPTTGLVLCAIGGAVAVRAAWTLWRIDPSPDEGAA